MKSLIFYLLESSLLLGLSLLYYRLVLQQRPHFQLSRWFLLGSLVAGLGLPLLSFSWLDFQPLEQVWETTLPVVELLPSGSETVAGRFDLLGTFVYFLGVMLLGAKMLFGLGQIIQLIRTSPREAHATYTLIRVSESESVASFFRYIFWVESPQWSAEEREQVLRHERCHVQQGHSWDLLAVECLRVLFWFQPLLWLFPRLIRQNHEYLADAYAIQHGNSRQYAQLLLSQLFGQQLPMVHSFYHSPVTKRIMMFQSTRSSQSLLIWLSLPALALLLFAVSCSVDDKLAEESSASKSAYAFAAEPNIDEWMEVESPPTPLNMSEIQKAVGYPKEVANDGIEGMIVARILVDQSGNYVRHSFVKTLDERLEDAISQEISNLQFEPAIQDGKGVKFWVNVPFRFSLLN
ncbi:MAG: M56 family metallopeptidase [Bacteroidota bacterium]